jgi:hypothetical protein
MVRTGTNGRRPFMTCEMKSHANPYCHHFSQWHQIALYSMVGSTARSHTGMEEERIKRWARADTDGNHGHPLLCRLQRCFRNHSSRSRANAYLYSSLSSPVLASLWQSVAILSGGLSPSGQTPAHSDSATLQIFSDLLAVFGDPPLFFPLTRFSSFPCLSLLVVSSVLFLWIV